MAPKYVNLANILKEQIRNNTLPSYKLPTEAYLCKKYHVSRQTVRHALMLLIEEDLITTRQGSGSYSKKREDIIRHKRIALILSSDTEYTYPLLIKDIRDQMQLAEIQIDIYITNYEAQEERTILNHLLQNPPAGLIAEACHSSMKSYNANLYEQLSLSGTSILFINGSYPNLQNLPSIPSKESDAGKQAIQYLLDKNHKNICCLFNLEDSVGIDRYIGARTCLENAGISTRDQQFFWYSSKSLSAIRTKQDTGFLSDLIQKIVPTYTAILCQSDEIAYWLIKELEYANLKVPDDISVCSFDSSYLCDLSNTTITSFALMNQRIGIVAAEYMSNMLSHRQMTFSPIEYKVIEKNSCRKL